MTNTSWVILNDSRYLGAMLAVSEKLGGQVCAVVVGEAELAQEAAKYAFAKVLHFPLAENVPAEAMGAAVAARAAADQPKFIIASDSPAARVLLGFAAGAVKAAVACGVIDAASKGEATSLQCLVAGGIAVEELTFEGPVAAIFDGDDVQIDADGAAAIEECAGEAGPATIAERILPGEGDVNISDAPVIFGVGRGVRKQEDLAPIEDLAAKLGGCVGCTLPLNEDTHWYAPDRVLGSSHNQAAPDLYFALGISGSPNHMTGVKGAKVIVAVNNDPEAEVFKRCNYGIVCDLYEFIPALAAAVAE